MAHNRPWYKRSGQDFVMATMSMPDSDTKWAYSCLIDILNDRDRPLTDDPTFICGFTGLSKRKWTSVRAYLLQHGYIVIDQNGDLTNPRFEREREERRREHEKSVESGRRGGRKSAEMRARDQQGDFFDLNDDASSDFNNIAEPPPSKRAQPSEPAGKSAKSELSPKKQAEKPEINATFSEDNLELIDPATNENNDLGQPPRQPTRARESALETRDIESESNERTESTPPRARAREAPRSFDRIELLDLLQDLTGYVPTSPGQIDREMKIIEGWIQTGIDYEQTIKPVIEHAISNSTDPTSSFRRFDRAVRHEHAKRKSSRNGQYRKPETPILEFEWEDERFVKFRRDMLERVGPSLYVSLMHHVTLEPVDERKALRINGKMADQLKSGDTFTALRTIARRHGFNDVW